MAILGTSAESIRPTQPVAASADGFAEDEGRSVGVPADRPAVPMRVPEVTTVDMGSLRDQIAQRLDEYLRESGRSLEFRVDNAAHTTVITVRRADTGEVVRQYPTEEALALLRRLNERSGTLLEAFA